MENSSSPARTPKNKKSIGCSPLSSRKSYMNSPMPIPKSCFSDDEGKSDDDENNKDLEEIAEKEDVLKSSRQDLYECISAALGKSQNSARKTKRKGETSLDIIQDEYDGHAKQVPLSGSPNSPQKKDIYDIIDKPSKEKGKSNMQSPLSGAKKNIYQIENKSGDKGLNDSDELAEMDEIKISTGTLQAIPDLQFEDPLDQGYLSSRLENMEGFIMKKSPNFFGGWEKRYLVLKNRKLCYYMNELKEVKIGIIDFNLITVKLDKIKATEFKVTPKGSSRIFYFKAQNEEERDKWLVAIGKHRHGSKGALSELEQVACIKEFWKNDRISRAMFENQVETGDIILFKTETILSKIQRSFTGSEYDHVALVVRYGWSEEIFLFEAMREGVGLCRWSTFMEKNWHKLYTKMIFRKLVTPRNQEIITEIQKFVKTNVGKKFQITPQKLLRKKTNEEDKTFFCSELVASCYKKLGYLPKDVSAASYYPGTFASDKKLKLINNAKLSQEYLIDFNI